MVAAGGRHHVALCDCAAGVGRVQPADAWQRGARRRLRDQPPARSGDLRRSLWRPNTAAATRAKPPTRRCWTANRSEGRDRAMTVRIGFDMDGVLADFASAYREVEVQLFGGAAPIRADDPGAVEEEPDAAASTPSEERRRRDAVWRHIRATENFWTTVAPIREHAVRRIHQLMLEQRWEVFFITQRPATRGETVQRQTQRWLVAQGFDLPSVLVIAGSRGAAAGALRLDYLVDDSATNCLDVLSDSRAQPILVVGAPDSPTARRARSLDIAVTGSVSEALDSLAQISNVS